jgi:hypothetical protein
MAAHGSALACALLLSVAIAPARVDAAPPRPPKPTSGDKAASDKTKAKPDADKPPPLSPAAEVFGKRAGIVRTQAASSRKPRQKRQRGTDRSPSLPRAHLHAD